MNTDKTSRPSIWNDAWRARNVVLPVIGILILGVGVGFQIWAAFHPASFGWFAYSPLSDTRFNPSAGSELGHWGQILCAAGLVVLAFWAGLFLGERNKAAH